MLAIYLFEPHNSGAAVIQNDYADFILKGNIEWKI